MATLVESAVGQNFSVGMGQIVQAGPPHTLTAVLGSCVGVAIYHPRIKLGVLGHIVLADSAGRNLSPGKFADTAIPAMLSMVEQRGGKANGAIIKIAGGACMFGKGGPIQIGEANIAAVLKALEKVGCCVAAKDVGGNRGRRVSLDCATGEYVVEMVGVPANRL